MLLALFMQLDFATRSRPALSSAVPAAFRAHSYEPLTSAALEMERDRVARNLAVELVFSRPVPAESLSLLAISADRTGESALAAQSISLAASRGWREPLGQSAVIYAALDAEDWRVAAERVDALQRSGHAELVSHDMMVQLLQTELGREALTARFVTDRNWFTRFLNMGRSGDLPPGIFADTVQLFHRADGQADCNQLSSVARRLLDRGDFGAAWMVWDGACARVAEERLSGFRPADRSTVVGPFDWAYPGSPGLSRSWQEVDGRWVMNFRHNDPLRAVLTERFMRLKTGNHTLQLDSGSNVKSDLTVRVRCVDPRIPLVRDQPLEGALTFEVPENCPVQRMTLLTTRGTGEGLAVIELSDDS
jgi:hypothetical protein